MKHSLSDTIAAIATPPGTAGVGVVRISGNQSIRISEQIIRDFPRNIIPQRVYHGWVVRNGRPMDEVLYYLMRAPNSYTGDDVVEISCHGSWLLLQELLRLAVEAGARPADRGEFSKRAFLNGKIDLLKAEAILDLVSARTVKSLEAASSQLMGNLSNVVCVLRNELLGILAEIEAGVDFPDDVEEVGREALRARVSAIRGRIEALLETANAGKVLREGVRMAIVGRPNVGKSSLLNRLLGEERAIVTDTPGTTRDTIEEVINIKGVPVVIVDTAGIRHPRDKVEEFGIDRARKEIAGADIAVAVLDASCELTAEDKLVLDAVSGSRLILALNKIDLGDVISLNGLGDGRPAFRVCALSGAGVDSLRDGIFDFVVGGCNLDGVGGTLVNLRHKEGLMRARESLGRTIEACNAGTPVDLVSIDIKGAVVALGEVSGEEVSEEVINSIFERFCVGK